MTYWAVPLSFLVLTNSEWIEVQTLTMADRQRVRDAHPFTSLVLTTGIPPEYLKAPNA